MNRFIKILFTLTLLLFAQGASAQDAAFYRATVTEVEESGENEFGEYQLLQIELDEGPQVGERFTIEAGDMFNESASKNLQPGDRIVVRTDELGNMMFVEKYRFERIIFLILLFAGLCVMMARKRGFYALIGLGFTVLVITLFLLPAIAAGKSLLLFGGISLVVITAVAVVFSHGVRATTMIAVLGIVLTMLGAALLAVLASQFAFLFGVGNETILHVQLAGMEFLDFRGLFLLGVLLGALGVLDDVTTAQASVVAELKRANPKYSASELFRSASSVGQEHMIAMINTLFLAYAGVSFPLLLLFYVDSIPVWAFVNSEMIAEEIVRTLVGSIALLFSVPLTTFLASLYFSNRTPLHEEGHSHSHSSLH